MKILCIGNSFSCDATRYLHQIARSQKEAWQISNLYIGGCSLEQHYRNMLRENEAYGLQINGNLSGFYVSLKEALLNRPWDVITIQQASHFSFNKETYEANKKKMETTDLLSVYSYYFNTTKAPFDKAEVRQALSIALDREEIAAISGMGVKPATGLVTWGVRDTKASKDFRKVGGKLISGIGTVLTLIPNLS